jgi:hypothetical protein
VKWEIGQCFRLLAKSGVLLALTGLQTWATMSDRPLLDG